ncbi:hypothetical protein BU24DRAFT_459894 [Aaosphaeria arxii CBS 175.79]|uniref:Uncharacterized protein n=1 Tax=Aaosphaeria arxii CBS 175.79 TaxID=1450172 RepID=A0A6A5Y513_9PLEO|nr:uncharacterized protein BU24DRAFT_459894 [Aaosphaeria arxii CBS 175.79]KAF2020303.1 hypothetical protein BU24DRAFT_459894 [Aaosphaeria arxii CBS 175.79]
MSMDDLTNILMPGMGLEDEEEMCDEDMLANHRLAKKNLKFIVAKIPAKAFKQGRKPSIWDIYTSSPRVIAYCCPTRLDLRFVFSCYDQLSDLWFIAKPGQDVDVNRAIWYWGMDKSHSFLAENRGIYYNLLVMVFTIAHSRAGYPTPWIAPGTEPFVNQFVEAWVAYVIPGENFSKPEEFLATWTEGKTDLMVFTEGQLDAMKFWPKGMKKKKALNDLLWNPMDFLVHGPGLLTQRQMDEYGMLLAYEFVNKVLCVGKKAQDRSPGGRMADPVVKHLLRIQDVNWKAPLVRALVEDDDDMDLERHTTGQKQRAEAWMDSTQAIAMLQQQLGDRGQE